METTTNPEAKMSSIATRTEQVYADLKLADRLTPGRTPWQTLRRRAEQIAADELLTEADAVASVPLSAIVSRADHYTIRNGQVVQADTTTPVAHLYRTREHAAAALPRR